MITVVTGAAGFVGTHCVAALADAGVEVRALTRRATPPDARPGVTWRRIAGLDDDATLVEALRGASAAVHLAARVHVMRETEASPDAAFDRVNVDGTRRLLAAMDAAGVKRIVFASSVKAVGERSDAPWTATTPAAPVDAYGRSKLAAEELVRAWAASDGRSAAILRLPLVYGAGVGGNFARLVDLVLRGVPVPVPGRPNRRSMVYVGNVAAAVAALVRLGDAGGACTYFVADERPVSTAELVEAIAAAAGRQARVIRIPVPAIRALARVGDLAARIMPVPFTSAAAARLTGSLEVDASELWHRLGHPPPFTLAEGVARTLAARGIGTQGGT